MSPTVSRRQCFAAVAMVVLRAGVVTQAHPGHGSKVVLGTLREVSSDAIVVEVRDAASGSTTRTRILLEKNVRYRVDKERLTSLDGMIGERAIVSVEWEDDDRGGLLLRATEVRFTRKRK